MEKLKAIADWVGGILLFIIIWSFLILFISLLSGCASAPLLKDTICLDDNMMVWSHYSCTPQKNDKNILEDAKIIEIEIKLCEDENVIPMDCCGRDDPVDCFTKYPSKVYNGCNWICP